MKRLLVPGFGVCCGLDGVFGGFDEELLGSWVDGWGEPIVRFGGVNDEDCRL